MVHSDNVPPKAPKDLKDAFYDDWKRKAVDSAKKRAVAQHVDYDTFKNMVSVAHLRAIGEKSRQAGADGAWNILKRYTEHRSLAFISISVHSM